MSRFFMRWGITALAIWIALNVVPGIVLFDRSVVVVIVIAAIFGLINALIRPVIVMLTCPLIVLTLGLGTILVNALMLWLTSLASQNLGIGFYVEGFWPAVLGSVVISIVSVVLNTLLVGDKERHEERERYERRGR